MLRFEFSKARMLLSDNEYRQAYSEAQKSFAAVREGTGPGANGLGWRDILADPNDAALEQLDSLAAFIRSEADIFIICAAGGSYLGPRTLVDALTPLAGPASGPEILYAGHHLSGKYMEQLLAYLEKPNAAGEPKKVYINVISKSGATLETALAFRTLRSWLYQRFPEDAHKRIICATSSEGGILNKLVHQNGYRKFVIPDDINKCFSVLTPVGLLPAAVAGIDIRTLFYEAVSSYQRFEKEPEPLLQYAAIRYALTRQGKAIDVLTSFEPELHSLCGWLRQLLGGSERKEGKGMFPVVGSYSTDLHSPEQYMQEGTRNMMETFITVEKAGSKLAIGEVEIDYDGFNYLAGQSYHEINRKVLEATVQTYSTRNVPVILVHLEELNAQHLGEFIYFYELMTTVHCYCLGVNPFNQPSVESYKKEMYQRLAKKQI